MDIPPEAAAMMERSKPFLRFATILWIVPQIAYLLWLKRYFQVDTGASELE